MKNAAPTAGSAVWLSRLGALAGAVGLFLMLAGAFWPQNMATLLLVGAGAIWIAVPLWKGRVPAPVPDLDD